MMVAFGMFTPTSTTVVHTRMSIFLFLNFSITSCFLFGFIFPCSVSIERSGKMFFEICSYSSSTDRNIDSSFSSMRGHTIYA